MNDARHGAPPPPEPGMTEEWDSLVGDYRDAVERLAASESVDDLSTLNSARAALDEYVTRLRSSTGADERVREAATRYRWNEDAEAWEFYQESWGGWCILRVGTHESTRPMNRVEGAAHIRLNHNRSDVFGHPLPRAVIVPYADTQHEPRRASLSVVPATGETSDG